MRKLKWSALPALLLIIALFLAACTAPSGTTETQATAAPSAEETTAGEPTEEPAVAEPTEAPAAEEEGDRQIATFIWTQEFDTLSPLYTSMW
ncbi:MAG TPA: hypothetical protein PLH39_01905, partial [Promineifilum sp.]|nr:hypothetical protein [Promineifilum sp.]